MRYKIFSNGEQINVIVADEQFCKSYCEKNSYTYELIEEPEVPPIEPEPAPETELTVNDLANAILEGVNEV